MSHRRAEGQLQLIVRYHVGLAGVAALLTLLVLGLALSTRDGAEQALTPAGMGLVSLLLGVGLHLRLEAVRRLELVLLPLLALGLAWAVLFEVDGDRRPKAVLVTALLWLKVGFAVWTLTRPEARVLFASGARPPLRDLLPDLRGTLGGVLALLAFVGLVAAFVALRFTLVPGAAGSVVQVVGTAVGAVVCALVIIVGAQLAWLALRTPQVDPAATARAQAFRAEGLSLVAIRRRLEAEGHGRWTTARIKDAAALPARPVGEGPPAG